MKRIFIILCLIMGMFFVYPLFSAGLNIAIMDLEPLAVKKSVALTATELLRTEFVKHPVFNVLERSKLKEILKEQSIQLSGMTTAGEAVEVGKLLNVKKIVFGSISKFEGKYVKYVITLRLVDIENGAIEISESINVPSLEELSDACSKIVKKIAEKISINGEIKLIEANTIYIDIGSALGIKKGDRLTVIDIKLIKDKEGKIIMREENVAGELEVISSDENGSKCKIVKKIREIKEGMIVKKSSTEIAGTLEKGNITVNSIPEGAKAYLDGEFIGTTPVVLRDINPGEYTIEIRHPGYESYKGKIHLTEGRNITIERELDRIVEIEDMLLGGKIPRRTTEPKTALTKALIPGWGAYYNGYKNLGIMTGIQITTYIGLSCLFFNTALEEEDRMNQAADANSFWDTMEYHTSRYAYNFYNRMGYYFLGYTALVYIYSLIDSYLSADDPFRYIEYTEIKVGGLYYKTKTSQTEDKFTSPDRSTPPPAAFNDSVKDMKSTYSGGFITFGYKSKRFDMSFWIGVSSRPLFIGTESHIKLPLSEKFFINAGMIFEGNMGNPENVEYTNTKPQSMLGNCIGPVIGISYESPVILFSIDYSPVLIGSAYMFVIGNSTSSWTENILMEGLKGYYIKARLDTYFSARFGLSLEGKYIELNKRYDDAMETEKLSVIEKHTDLLIYFSPVFRF